ncbi:multidrug ABC transporter permease [Corynebacterium ulcerans]|uniref:multidrug ABC transporter permease n=1 Tax=Corynebacterium ulcerans TaxID=65058 RepID=UPI00051F6BA1|nr:multidrug ABC transporter permease [Corynebacterium ulcerans]AIT88205.1 ABC transporter permease [Corynebacterium ulcerans]ALD93973.1 ABC transporter permease [Corynebacterium ulcerans]SQG57174.1 Uncharacterised protein [Corynebacterium ulcerans]
MIGTTRPLVGTGVLLKATLRHELKRFIPWIAIVTMLSTSSILAYAWMFPHREDRAVLDATIGGNPALGLIFGPARNLYTNEGFNTWRAFALGGFLTGIAAIFAVTKATRGQEDSGQAELLASGAMGRGARLAVAVLLGVIGSTLIGVVTALCTLLCGAEADATLLLAATFTATGWMMSAVAAVAAQLGSTARAANTLAVSTLSVLFILRGFLLSLEAPAFTWVIAFVALGVIFGYFIGSVKDLLASSPAMAAMMAGGAVDPAQLVNNFAVTMLSMLGIIAAIPGVQVVLRIVSEENSQRIEPILTGGISRLRYCAVTLAAAAATSTACLLFAGVLVAWLSSRADIGLSFSDVFIQSAVTSVATWPIIGIAAVVVGARPRFAIAAWVGVLESFFITIFGPTFKAPDWTMAFSPFHHIPHVMESDAHGWGVLGLLVASALLCVIGCSAFNRRDIGVG